MFAILFLEKMGFEFLIIVLPLPPFTRTGTLQKSKQIPDLPERPLALFCARCGLFGMDLPIQTFGGHHS